jgi:hypothetical protein
MRYGRWHGCWIDIFGRRTRPCLNSVAHCRRRRWLSNEFLPGPYLEDSRDLWELYIRSVKKDNLHDADASLFSFLIMVSLRFSYPSDE